MCVCVCLSGALFFKHGKLICLYKGANLKHWLEDVRQQASSLSIYLPLHICISIIRALSMNYARTRYIHAEASGLFIVVGIRMRCG